jgi:hypothetical protein
VKRELRERLAEVLGLKKGFKIALTVNFAFVKIL